MEYILISHDISNKLSRITHSCIHEKTAAMHMIVFNDSVFEAAAA